MINILFTELAAKELREAVDYYEFQHPGLGERLQDEIEQGIALILKHPQAWLVERDEIRKYLLNKFPYKILYSIENEILTKQI